jgi:hypothetical protein
VASGLLTVDGARTTDVGAVSESGRIAQLAGSFSQGLAKKPGSGAASPWRKLNHEAVKEFGQGSLLPSHGRLASASPAAVAAGC